MSQVFYDTFDPNEIVQTTMENIIEDSMDALRTSFEGSGAPPTPKPSQFYSNTTDNKLQIRAQDDSGWDDIYDFTNQEVVLSTGQVDAVHISDTARKGSIVTDEAIDPATCTIQAKFKVVSLPTAPCEFFPLFTAPASTSGVGVLTSSGSFTTLLTSKLYIPEDAGTLYAMIYQVTSTARFIVESLTSNVTGDITGPAWGPIITLDVSSLSGWQDITVQANSSVGVSPFGGIGGVSFRWEN
jgi:hypothetical protein